MKSLERIDTAVIGAGQAGLTISQQLTELGRSHLVLEAQRPPGRRLAEALGQLLPRNSQLERAPSGAALRRPGA